MSMYSKGQAVYVRKYGAWYPGTITHVASTGTLKILFTPKNGNTKETRIDWRDVPANVRGY